MSKMFTKYYQNVREMRTKTEAIGNEFLKHDYNLIVLIADIHDHEFIDSRYNVYRRDRMPANGGSGVLIAVNKKIESLRINTWQSDCEDIDIKNGLHNRNIYLFIIWSTKQITIKLY